MLWLDTVGTANRPIYGGVAVYLPISCKQYCLYINTVVTFVKRTFVTLLKYNEVLETRMDFSFPRSPDASYCTFLGNFEFSSTEISTEKYRRLINI